MIGDFDVDPIAGHLVLWCRSISGETSLRITEPSGEIIGEVPPEFLPHHPRWAPDGLRLTFSGNDGRIGVYDLSQDSTTIVYEDRSRQAGFSQWSPDGKAFVFSAYQRPVNEMSERRPPDIFHFTLENGKLDRLTALENAVDRFPYWSPSGDLIAFHRQNLEEFKKPMRVYLIDRNHDREWALLPKANKQRFGRFAWSPDGNWFSLHEDDSNGGVVRVVDPAGRDSGWTWEEGPVQEGAFSRLTDRLLCILPDELVWVQFPEGRIESRIKLESGVSVAQNLTWYQIAFGAGSDTVFFLGTDHKIYRWDESEECTVVAEHTEYIPSFRLEEFTVRASDGLALPAQRLIPASPREVAVLYVHGGPGETLERNDSWALGLVNKGFEVVRVAYRGSTGFGDELYQASTGLWGVTDVQDVIDCGLYWQQQFGMGRKIALFGNSYGGFLSLLALTDSSSPFVGGIATCAATSLHVMRHHHDKALPRDPKEREIALKERSLMTRANHIKRPILLFHGALDTVAATSDIQRVEKSINDSGGDCSLVVFGDDTHSLAKHREKIYERAIQFSEKCLLTGKGEI